jgi:hypothetical protein
MKKISEFLEYGPMWKIFILGWFVTGLVVFFISLTFFGDDSLDKILIVSTVFGILFGAMFSGMISMARASDKFWEKSKLIEKLIDDTNTKDGLESIYQNDFKVLQKLSMGKPHNYELNRIFTIIKTKYKYVKNDIEVPTIDGGEDSPEREVLNKIKFVLSAGNDAQAIRLIEQYGFWKEENAKIHNPQLQSFINQFEEGNEFQELSNEEWSVSDFLNWLKINNFEVVKK